MAAPPGPGHAQGMEVVQNMLNIIDHATRLRRDGLPVAVDQAMERLQHAAATRIDSVMQQLFRAEADWRLTAQQ